MILDVEEVGKDRANLVQLPDPILVSELPDEVADFFRKPMPWPDAQDQELFTVKDESVPEQLGRSGTIAYMPQCDRLTYAKARTLAEHAVKEMSRVYRRAISDGLTLYVNNRRVESFDPTYAMPSARHTKFLQCGVGGTASATISPITTRPSTTSGRGRGRRGLGDDGFLRTRGMSCCCLVWHHDRNILPSGEAG